MQEILSWMESSGLARFVLDNAWVFPTLETLHFFGLILLIGSIYIVDLRFLGMGAEIPLQAVMRFLPVTAVGFAINLITGTMFVFSDPVRYYPNLAFRLKMTAVLLAGLNALWFKFAVHAHGGKGPVPSEPGGTAKLIAALSLVLWTSVIVFGRMIPYLE